MSYSDPCSHFFSPSVSTRNRRFAALYSQIVSHHFWLIFFIALGCFFPAKSFAQINESLTADHVRISLLGPDYFAADPAAQNATLGVYVEPDPEWHVYWKNPGDSGTAPRFVFNPANLSLGEILWPYPARLPVEHLVNLGYERDVAYLFKAGVEPADVRSGNTSPRTARVEVELEWLVCKEECIPGFGTLAMERPIRGDNHQWKAETKAIIDRFQERIPGPSSQSPWLITCAYWSVSNVLTLKLEPVQPGIDVSELTVPEVYPLNGNFVNPAAPQVTVNQNFIELRFNTIAGTTAPATTGFVIATDGRAWELPSVVVHRGAFTEDVPLGFWLLLLSAFVGGVILNLMPCVFPVLSIKLFSLINTPGEGKALLARRLREGLLYTAGVLATFGVLGLIFLSLRAGGAAIGWGFQLQSPVVVLGLVMLFWLMALSFLGSFEFGSRLMQVAGGSKSNSSFMTGVLAVFVAAPCTGPFMGAALGAAAVLPAFSAMAIFLGLGLGLAAPFLILAVSPTLSSRLPKPGQWMETLRQFLAFPLFATVIWLLWVLGQLAGDVGWLLGTTLLLSLSFAIWLGKSARVFWRGIAWAIAITALVLTLAFVSRTSSPEQTGSQGQWQAYNAELIAEARTEGRAVFIDFTAAWCITCQVNKKMVLDTSAADRLFSDNNVLRIRADWTRYDPEITAALAAFGRNSIPVYIYYPPDGSMPKMLPQVLTIDMIRELF
jgi:DsbC/DsbD-like thiol-disulfide interchange protein/cytochrome c biogenesis protein CcdA